MSEGQGFGRRSRIEPLPRLNGQIIAAKGGYGFLRTVNERGELENDQIFFSGSDLNSAVEPEFLGRHVTFSLVKHEGPDKKGNGLHAIRVELVEA